MPQPAEVFEVIGKVTDILEQIAFRTNTLALRAAVEAARAGEYGRSFAVVAEDARLLAQRAAQAASDTADLIEQVGNGDRNETDSRDRAIVRIDALTQETAANLRESSFASQ